MKPIKAKELRGKTDKELRDRETEIAEQLFALRLQKVTGQLQSPARIRALKRELARVLTVLTDKTRRAS